MKTSVCKTFLALALACVAVSCSPKVFRDFTFVQMTDPQIGFRDNSSGFEHTDSLFARAVKAVNALNPECVIITGDLVNDAQDRYQDSIYRSNRSKIKPPVYEILGNHDIRPWTAENYEHYVSLRGKERFSFHLNGCAFIGFDSNLIKDGSEKAEAYCNRNMSDVDDHVLFATIMTNAQLAEAQFTWLERQLRKARRCKYIFVFLHCPIIKEDIAEKEDYFNFSFTQRRRYIELFKKYGVDVVFAGHTHMDYHTQAEGIRFVIAGPVGSPLGRGYSGFEIVRVSDFGVDCRYVATSGVKR